MTEESNDAYTMNVKGLDQLMKALKGKLPKARVGILGDTSRRPAHGESKAPSNAEVGAAHEFGTTKLPIRSWLRMPISTRLQKEMDKSQLFTAERLKQVIALGSITPWLKEVAVCAEACVSDAFDTSGFGTWPSWSTPGYENNAGQLLVDTKQLRESVTSEVKE